MTANNNFMCVFHYKKVFNINKLKVSLYCSSSFRLRTKRAKPKVARQNLLKLLIEADKFMEIDENAPLMLAADSIRGEKKKIKVESRSRRSWRASWGAR